jgi:hypothetical protein
MESFNTWNEQLSRGGWLFCGSINECCKQRRKAILFRCPRDFRRFMTEAVQSHSAAVDQKHPHA